MRKLIPMLLTAVMLSLIMFTVPVRADDTDIPIINPNGIIGTPSGAQPPPPPPSPGDLLAWLLSLL